MRLSPLLALQKFGFRQGLKGALITAILVAAMIFIQGYGYIESYPDKASQESFARSMEAAPSLGILYGSLDNLHAGPNGYIVYRVAAFMSLIVAVWGLMAMTKLLRGSEEDGRWEVIRAGSTTALSSAMHVSLGFIYAFLLSFCIASIATIIITNNNSLHLAIDKAVLITCAIYAPGLLFITLGTLVSQLAITRRRALLYGLIPLMLAYFIRSLGNTNPDLQELLHWTPFGWNMLISPVVSPQVIWLLPFAILSTVFFVAGVLLARRDLGSSIIRESTTVKSRFYLLKSGWQLALRQNFWVFVAWAAGALAMGGIVASILNIAADATSSSTLSDSVKALAGTSADIRIAFLGAGLVFVVLVLLILATVIIGSVRNDEAKQYLDNILVQPKTRSLWLVSRLVLGVIITIIISFACTVLIYYALPKDLDIDFAKLATVSVSMLGTVIFIMGVGTLLYGILPRAAVMTMYLVITWSFIIDLVHSVVKLDEWLMRTSLFHYMTFDITAWPDWSTFAWLIGIALIMMSIGTIFFAKRDIVTE